MADWWATVRGQVWRAGRQALIGQAAAALASYLTESGWSPADLAHQIDSGSNWVLAALAALPPTEVGQARWAFGRVAAELTPEDFWEIVKHDALHRAHHAHALVLADPARWPRTLRCFQEAQAWLVGGNRPADAAPPPS